MRISYRSYPYPVLSHFSDDYGNCAFQTSLKVSSTKNAYKLAVKNNLSDVQLKDFVSSGHASYGLHVECKPTRYRILHASNSPDFNFEVPVGSVSGSVEVCCLLIAKNSVPNYTNTNFHKDFDGHSFDIEKGDVLAVAHDRAFEADNYLDTLKKVPSIFSITANKEENPPPIDTNYGDSKITILLPIDIFEKYRYLKADISIQPILASMIIIPVLVEIISDLKNDVQGFLEDYGDARWFKSIKSTRTNRLSTWRR